ncbi:hypothetical protein [Gilvimarinus sp. 1_MG-2023]|uniref:hypothetical protein n=1 Tax=Gilvimarinus sp. 1_MG-2023 TaxID=3062638 RepID=UPI0026E319B9|nr:hypothetical protein [Gilvimarinus sp. 1_MG-2023]MDO6746278.1 hypothetical protein [Gilvimarinus sp. 1_MG-2023]
MAAQETPASAATQYIALPFVSWPLHEAERMVLPRNGRQAQPLHETLVQMLFLCDRWRSLDQHIALAIEQMPQLQPHAQQLHQGLQHMVEQGLLVDADTLSQHYAEPTATEPEPTSISDNSITTLYVRTYCCPQALERLLQSLQPGGAAISVRNLVVIDDARQESDVAITRTLLTNYRKVVTPILIHVTREDREHLADAIAAASAANTEDLRWWLNGDPDDPDMTAGATFNTALLLSAGTNTAILDDDAQLTPYGDPLDAAETGNTQMGGSQKEDACWHLYPSSEAMESAWATLELDPLAEHSRWLGQSLPTMVDQTSNPKTFWSCITSANLQTLQPSAKVKMTVNGILGDPGTGEASWLFTQSPEVLAPWQQSENDYRQLTSRRLIARKPQGNQLLPYHILLTPLVGIDNSELMPPTTPNGRGEDAIFAELACGVYPDCLFAQLPWMLKHTPEQERQFNRDKLLTPTQMPANRLLTRYLGKLRHQAPSANPKIRLQWLGQSLQVFAQAPESTLATDYQRYITGDRSAMAHQLIRNLKTLQPPEYLAKDMQLLLARCQQGVDTDQTEKNTVLTKARQRADRYGRGLDSWITAWEYCRGIGESQTLKLAQGAPHAAKPTSETSSSSPLTQLLQKWGIVKHP